MKIRNFLAFAIIAIMFTGCMTREVPPKTEVSNSESSGVSQQRSSGGAEESASAAPAQGIELTAELAQDQFEKHLDYFRIGY